MAWLETLAGLGGSAVDVGLMGLLDGLLRSARLATPSALSQSSSRIRCDVSSTRGSVLVALLCLCANSRCDQSSSHISPFAHQHRKEERGSEKERDRTKGGKEIDRFV